MRTSRPRQRTPALGLAVQDLNLRRRFPGFGVRRAHGAYLWRGGLQPRPCSPIYRVEVRYRDDGVPSVRVLSPKLAPNAPHLYRGGTLCLYWPKEWRWHGDQLIADTILPWAASWLYYYELWLDTGEWLGPSSHDLSAPKADDDRAA